MFHFIVVNRLKIDRILCYLRFLPNITCKLLTYLASKSSIIICSKQLFPKSVNKLKIINAYDTHVKQSFTLSHVSDYLLVILAYIKRVIVHGIFAYVLTE